MFCDICDAQTSGTRFKATHRTPAPLFCIRPCLPFSRALPCFLSRLCPSSNTTACLRSCFPLSQLTGWHTFQRTKSLSEKTEENTRVHKGTHVIICKHRHAHWDADTSYAQPNTQMNTRTERQTCCIHTHKQTLPKSSSVMPSHHTLDKPLCEPDKAGEGTQQPLNTGAGCIRQLSVPVDCIHTLHYRVLYALLYDSGKTSLNGFAISLLIHCC